MAVLCVLPVNCPSHCAMFVTASMVAPTAARSKSRSEGTTASSSLQTLRTRAALHLCDRARDQSFERIDVELRQPLEVQTRLTHRVLAEPGQELALLGALRQQVND